MVGGWVDGWTRRAQRRGEQGGRTEDVSRHGVAGGVRGREVRDKPAGKRGVVGGRCADGRSEELMRDHSLEEAFYREELSRVLPKGDEDGQFLGDRGVCQPEHDERLAVSGASAILQSNNVWIFGSDLPHITAGTIWSEKSIIFIFYNRLGFTCCICQLCDIL
jgi:hypothetical protein